ncbi:hypothetical protein [Botrimarina hoheduenensis]|uniref:Uncharacterized protein n=1 Tax=Botrimarina hoheduenensis TaxID=2528000 RepID=A0A5C5W979_9BACT|nr:hypothetical protein [Botrimarina hoheduenensis]TWT47220.1 hypothetical protein Pla111_08320 [Botrimarina hoheduenensis]
MDEGPKSLAPEDDSFLPVEEVITRLRKVFSYVVADAEKGAASIDGTIEYYEKRKRHSVDADEHYDAIIEELRSHRSRSYMLTLADSEDYGDAYLTTVVEPDKPIFFGFSSPEHERKALPMVQRFADATGYDIE